ncbi:tetratricopeptide repeat protein [Escherichia coli]|uniref:tetratricopeptide repeat protein n=1 Tax=Escherichia coli TaxID=562 RepID=UPI00190DD5FE|nr:tetratricopeptide repeat protein [Escherichia coli]MBK2451742.1 sel1 repeat family protein [Escherichia coli]
MMAKFTPLIVISSSALLAGCMTSTIDNCSSIPGVTTTAQEIGRNGGVVSLKMNHEYDSEATEIAHQMCDSDRGNSVSQLELGKRYESGRGVEVDLKKAAELYRSAAISSDGRFTTYSPPATLGGTGQVTTFNGSPRVGLPEARYRLGLMYLDGRGVRSDVPRGWRLVEEAAASGWEPAVEKLRERPSSNQ